MEKIVKTLFLVASVTLSLGSFVSCKDYNEDLRTELKSDISKEASLREALQTQLNSLKATVDAIKSCECDLTKYLTKQEAASTYLTQGAIQSSLDQIAANKTAIELLQSAIDAINGKLADKSDIEDLQAAIDAINAKLSDKSDIEGLQAAIDALKAQMANKSDVEALQAAVDALKAQSANKSDVEALQAAVDAVKAQLAGLGDKTVAEQINEVNVTILNVSSIANEALELAKSAGKYEGEINTLKERITTLEGLVAGWDEKLTEVNKKAADAMAKAEENAIWIEKNKETIDAMKKLIEDDKILERLQAIEATYMKKDEITTLVDEAKAAAKTANDLAEKAMAQAEVNSGKIGDLEDAVKKLVSTEEFQDEIDKIHAAILGIAIVVDAIDAELVKVKADLTSMITGIVAHTTSNPVLGYINTPFGINQYLLAAYYGQADNGIEFPARDGKYYLNATDVETWTPRNLQVMGVTSLKKVEGYFTMQNERFVSDVDGDITGNAGTIYVTINPSNVNFTGQLLDLETSTQKASPIALGALEPSNEELDFGVYRTRSVENGFYEAKATLQVEDIDKANLEVNLSSLKDAVKEVLNERTRVSLADASSKIIRSLKNDIPAYGLKASWTDQSNGQVHNIYSQYNIATLAVKPLSFAFAKDVKANRVDGFDRARSILSRIIKAIEIKVPDFKKYEINFKSIKIGEDITTSENGKIYVPVTVAFEDSDEIIEIEIENLYGDVTETITELVDEINERYGEGSEIDQKLADFFNVVKETNNFQTYIDDAKSSAYNAVNKYLTNLEDHILRVVNNAHRSLYIALFGEQGKDIALLSNSLDVPTKAKAGELQLFPTTYSQQYFAPIYKKFVAVTNVYDAKTKAELDLADAKTIAAAANGGENMLKVVDGLKNCSFKGEAGKIYEITYTAVDFLGVVMIKKYYVEF